MADLTGDNVLVAKDGKVRALLQDNATYQTTVTIDTSDNTKVQAVSGAEIWLQVGATIIGKVSATGLDLQGKVLSKFHEKLATHTNAGSTETIDISSGSVHTIPLDANCTFTFSGSVASAACSFTAILKQDSTGGRTATWPAAVKWPGGVAPTLSTAANATDVFVFLTVDNGTTWLGHMAGKGYA